MRFEKLNFVAFGPFTALELDLRGGAPGGFHVIYGPNEAGKSSALRGVHDFLFGFPERSRDDHLHRSAELCVAAELSDDSGQTRSFRRLKKRKDSLRDQNSLPIAEQTLAELLRGVDAPLFERLFGLDHARLQEAGKALLEDKGDAGESLFDAGFGGPSIGALRKQLERGAEEIFKARSKARLNALLDEYKEARLAHRNALVLPEKWFEQQKHVDLERQKLAVLSERRKKLREELAAQSRLDGVLGPMARRRDLLEKLAALGELPVLASNAGELRAQAQRTLDEAAPERARLERELEKKRERLAELLVPERLLEANAELIEKLRDRAGKFRATSDDLPRRYEEARGQEAELRRLSSQLYPERTPMALSDLEALRPNASQLATLRRLPLRRAELGVRIDAQEKAMRLLLAQQAQITAALSSLPPPRELGIQRRVLQKVRASGEVERRIRELEAAGRRLLVQAEAQRSGLDPWTGELEGLPFLKLPSEETVSRYEREFDEATTQAADEARQQAMLEQRQAECGKSIRAIEGSGSVPSEAALLSARERRDDGLERMLAAWDRHAAVTTSDAAYFAEGTLVEGFRRALDQADDHADRLWREAGRVAELSALHAEREHFTRELAALAGARAELGGRRAAVAERWRAAWRTANIDPASPREMRAWLGRQRQLSELVERLLSSRQELIQTRLERDELCAALQQALGREASLALTLAPLIAECEEIVEAASRAADERLKLQQAQTELELKRATAEQELERERGELAAWQSDWRRALGRLGLDVDLTIDEFALREEALASFLDGLPRLSDLRRRIASMEQDRAQFALEVKKWALSHAPDLEPHAPDVAAEELARRVQAAVHKSAEYAQVQRDITDTAQALAARQSRIEQAAAELERLREAAGVANTSELSNIEARVQTARHWREALSEIEASLLQNEGVTLDTLEQQTRGLDRANLNAQVSELKDEIERVDEEYQNSSAQVRDLEAGLQVFERVDAADSAQELCELGAEIREQALRYARLKLSAVVLQKEIDRYREHNQGPVLKRASALFPRLTLGRFRGLRVGVEERHIVALREDGKELTVDALSEGSRYQLYLALRIASLERYLERNQALPLVLDDVLIHFDNERAGAAFGVLGELAERVQILFFTHHARDVSLAEQSVPSARLFRHSLVPS